MYLTEVQDSDSRADEEARSKGVAGTVFVLRVVCNAV